MTHDHARPSLDDQRAALDTASAILLRADHDAHQAAATGSCPQCTTIAGISFVITVTSTMAGDQMFVSERTRLALLAAVEAAQRELDARAN
jgi:hypothetical protein